MAYSHSIDDADPRITYSTAWDFITSDHFTMPQWSGTAHSTSTIGTTARLRFTGSAIAVICIIPTSGGGNGVSRASFSLDNGPAKEVHIPTTLPVQFEVEFWNSGPLPFGPHSLVITNIGNDAYFRFDRVDYDPTDSHAPRSPTSSPPRTLTVTQTQSSRSSPPIPASSLDISQPSASRSNSASITESLTSSDLLNLSSSGLTSPSGTITAPVNQPSDAPLIIGGGINGSATSSTSSESQIPIASIVGGTLGGLLILLLVVFVTFVRRRRAGQAPQHLSDDPNSVATPFDTESSHQMSNGDLMTSAMGSYPHPLPLASKAAMLGLASNAAPHHVLSSQPGSTSDIYSSNSSYSTTPLVDDVPVKHDTDEISVNRNSNAGTDAPPPAYYTRPQNSV